MSPQQEHPAEAAGPPASAQVLDFMSLRLERSLRQRVRYRYVRPNVLREGESFRIESPCCSRNVDPQGGVIDIALLAPCTGGWRLFSRNHVLHAWVLQHECRELDALLDLLCIDSDRQFWP